MIFTTTFADGSKTTYTFDTDAFVFSEAEVLLIP